jgi:hypothetical protein
MRMIRHLVGRQGIKLINNEKEIVYNIMLEEHSYMKVNNLVVETLHPSRKI